jgi:hypothetical protein
VRAHAGEAQGVLIGKFVNQQQIGFQMALAMALPITAERVVPVLFRKRAIVCYKADDLR